LWGHGYIEGAAWQFAFSVPHDFEGLCEVYGGRDGLVEKVEAMLAEPPYFDGNDYGYEIHEMTEMGAADFGQYAHSNQPVHHVLALFALAGRHDLCRRWTHRVLNELYSPDHFLGDEDNGEMASWFILSSLGLFPSCPGRAEWTLGWPLFPRVVWRLGNGNTLVIECEEADCREVFFNGTPITEPVIAHSLLARGGTLHFRGK
jgi:putative alpha-1,2-mannosidase